MKFTTIKRTRCNWCKKFVSCAITNGIAACSKCDPERFEAAGNAQKEAWLRGESL